MDIKDLQDKLVKMRKKWPNIVHQESEAVMWLIVNKLESTIKPNTPVGVSGALRGSIFGEVRTFGKSVQGIVGTPLEYANVVEFGRRPGKFPPIAPIELWVRRKLGVPESESKQVGFLVARKIARKGFPGKFMFRNAFNQQKTWVENQLKSIPDRVFRRVRM